MSIKISRSIAALLALAAVGIAHAQTATPVVAPAAAPAAPENTLAYNVELSSDYRYRGISQSGLSPALSGGIDYTHKTGLYVGTWLSNIKWVKDSGGSANVEWDLYGGYKTEFVKDWTYDIGVLAYIYPSNALSPSANTGEIYGALTYGITTLKYSYAVTNLFGYTNSKGSGYTEISANFDVGNGWSIVPHAGYQKVQNLGAGSFADYALSVTKDFGAGFTATLAAMGTNANKAIYIRPNGQLTGRDALVLSGKYTF